MAGHDSHEGGSADLFVLYRFSCGQFAEIEVSVTVGGGSGE
jgi:hypothetical protein